MKTFNIILLSILSCIGGIIFFFACKHTYDSKVEKLKQDAHGAFIEALNEELKIRDMEGELTFHLNTKTVSVGLPDSVSLEDSSGIHRYRLDPEKHKMNVTESSNLRFIHTFTFLKNPLSPNSLNTIWERQLSKHDISAQSVLLVSVTDHQGKIKTRTSAQEEWCNPSHQIFTVYIGYACEIEVIGYLHYSLWQKMYMVILLYLIITLLCIYGVYKISLATREKIRTFKQTKIIEKTVIQVVQETTETPIHSYKLQENIIFYAEQKTIEVNGMKYKVQSQTSQLLELFLREKENHILAVDTINQNLWTDGSGNSDRIHQAIARLRTLLRKLDSSFDIKKNPDNYQLIL